MHRSLRHLLALAVLLASAAPAQDSPLVQGRTADMWLVDPVTGQVTAYDTGGWLNAVDTADFPLIDLDGAGDVLLINRLPNSSVPMTPGQPQISLVGLGSVALLAGEGGQGGHPDLLIMPDDSAVYSGTTAIRVLVSGEVLAKDSHRLTWSAVDRASGQSVASGDVAIAQYAGGDSENGYYGETFYLVNNGTYDVTARLRGTTVDITKTAAYTLNIDPADARRDTDGDGIPDAVEIDMGLNPLEDDWMADTDGNGWSEFDEWLRRFCLDPVTKQPLDTGAACLDANGIPVDTDLDDWADFDEILRGTNHLDPEPDIVPQGAAPPANQLSKAGSTIAQGASLINDATFCTDGSTFWFDLRFHADADDSISNDIILGVGADYFPFGNPNHSIRVNFGEQGQITRQEPIVRTGTTVDVTPLERWQVGPIDDFTIDSVGVEEWHVYGSVPVGADPFAPGDVVANFAIRSGVSGNTGGGNYTISGNPADCTGEVVVEAPEYTEYVAQQRLRYKDYPAANRLYEVEHVVDAGAGLLVIPPTANLLFDQQSAGTNQGGYGGIVVQSFTPSQDNIAGIDVRIDAGGEGIEDIILNIWSGEPRTGQLLLTHRIDDVDRNGDPGTAIPIRFEPVAVQPGQPVYFEFRKDQAALVTTGADTLANGAVIEIEGSGANGQTDLLFDVYYDTNFANGVGGTRAGMQWWTVGASDLDGMLAYDATTLVRDDEIGSAGLTPADIAPRRRMLPLANALGANRLPEMRLPAGESVVVSAIHRHHIPEQNGWKAPSDYSRIYKAWLARRDDVTPADMLAEQGEGSWATPDEWRREFVAYLVPRLVVPADLVLDETSTLAVAVIESALTIEADLDDSGDIQIINGIYQPGQPIYAYQPGQPQYGDLFSHQSPYINEWEDELERLSGTNWTLDDSFTEVSTALGPGQALESVGSWLRERFYAGKPGSSSDKYMAQQVLSAFPDVCFVPAEDVAARQTDVAGWRAFIDQCPAWVSETGLAQMLEAERERAYLLRLNMLPGSSTEIASDATLLDLFADSDSDGAANSSEIERAVAQLTLPWLFDSDGDSIADALDPCQNDPFNECSADPILPTVTLDADFVVSEPGTGIDYALVSVQLDRMYDDTVTVCYEAVADAGDTATPDSDFASASGCVEIAPGQMSALIRIPINGDAEIEGGETFTVRITSIENATSADDGVVVITINEPAAGENNPPVFTSSDTAMVVEGNTNTGYTATVFDADGDTITFSIAGGVDSGAFSIDSGNGVLSFVTAPSFAAPTDADGNNVYEVQLGADDGNGGTATLDLTISVIEEGLKLEVVYPTADANLGGGVTTTIVRGNIVDRAGNPVELADISFVDVNGTLATLQAGNPAHWSVQVPVSEGDNTLSITVEFADSTTIQLEQPLQNRTVYHALAEIALDIANDRAFIVDGFLKGVASLDINTGEMAILSMAGVGAGPTFSSPRGIAFDEANGRVLVGDYSRDSLTAVDIATGNRTDVSRLGTIGTGESIDGANAVAVDSAAGVAYVAAFNNKAVISVDLATGNRTVITGLGVGTGPEFLSPQGIVFDASNNRCLVSDSGLRAIVTVDLATGDRTVLSDAATGTGRALTSPADAQLDAANNRVLVADQVWGLFAVDLTSGDRTVLSDPGATYGRNGSRIQSVGYDAATNTAYVPDQTVDAVFAIDLADGTPMVLADSSSGNGPLETGMWGMRGLTYDSDGARLVMPNWETDVVIGIDVASASRSVIASSSIGTGPIPTFPGGVVIDADNRRAILTDQNLPGLYAVDLDTGDRTVLADNAGTGAGPAFSAPADVFVDAANNRATVLDSALGLLQVDLATGNRSVLSDSTTGTGPEFGYADGLGIDLEADTGYVVDDGSSTQVIKVDLSTGDRSILSDNVVGTGRQISFPNDIALDLANNRALILNRGSFEDLMAIDLATGDRTVISGSGVGTGPVFISPYFVDLDLDNDRAFVYDIAVTGVILIDLTTGNRVVMSK